MKESDVIELNDKVIKEALDLNWNLNLSYSEMKKEAGNIFSYYEHPSPAKLEVAVKLRRTLYYYFWCGKNVNEFDEDSK